MKRRSSFVLALRAQRRRVERAVTGVLARLPVSSRVLGPPRGLVSVADVPDVACHELHPGYPVSYPRFPYPLVPPPEPPPFEIAEPATFAAIVPDARVWGGKGAVITADDRVIRESATLWGHPAENHEVFSKIRLSSVRRVPGTLAVIAGPGASSFYHWMVEVLPRLELVRLAGIEADSFVVGQDCLPFQRETLDRLGVPAERRIGDGTRRTHLAAERVICVSRTTDKVGRGVPQWAIDWLRASFLDGTPDEDPTGLVYVVRRARGVVNEPELQAMLTSRGFEPVYLEDLPIAEQAARFADARVVVAPHGAGLTHVVFCRPGTLIVELFSPARLNGCFWHLCRQLQLPHVGVVGSVPPGAAAGDDAFTVPLADVDSALAAANL